ncbi:unnamed protein product [Nesidiocoris tenuis]|uniref:Uncharacterized protein n=1 Tax=Nesidiocoris tenuis TaxID=355587 RepID=A0A6H5G7M6_9HEMI|nr:unnamed protein product [Nesidiocoris tenuis]
MRFNLFRRQIDVRPYQDSRRGPTDLPSVRVQVRQIRLSGPSHSAARQGAGQSGTTARKRSQVVPVHAMRVPSHQTARPDGAHFDSLVAAAFRLRHLRLPLHVAEEFESPRLASWEDLAQAVHVSTLRSQVYAGRQPASAYAQPHGRQALRMFRLRLQVHAGRHSQKPRTRPYRGKALRLHQMRLPLQAAWTPQGEFRIRIKNFKCGYGI